MDVFKSINIKQPILQLKALNNGLLSIIDAHTAMRIFSLKEYNVIGGFKSNISHERIIGTHVDVTPDGNYCISILPGTNKSALFSVQKKELLYKIGRHIGEVESVAIDPNGRYCVTCGQDGKVFVWVLKTARLAFSLPPHGDFVTAVAFNDSSQWIATGSFDRTIHVMNMGTMKPAITLRGHSCVILKLVFLPEVRLLSADKEGNLIIWDIRNGKLLKRLPKMNDEITALCISDDKQFVFIGTKLGYVALYNMQTMELIKQRYIKINESISALAFTQDSNVLSIGTTEGNVHFYSLFGDQEAYLKLIREHQYKLFYEILEDNPMLLYSKAYAAAERMWEDVVKKSIVLLEKKEKIKAKGLLNLFAGIPVKNTSITRLLHDYEKYAQFQTYVQEGRYPLAYSLARQYTGFQDSEPYRKIEGQWKKNFAKAQELIMQPNGDEQARILLAPYRGISDKTVLIQALFAERRVYEYFKKIIAQNYFVKFFELVKNHPFLKEFAEYDTVMDYADKLYIQAQKSYANNDFHTAVKTCDILTVFPDYSLEAQQMFEMIRARQLFIDVIASKNLEKAFSHLNSYPLLYETAEAQQLERQWNQMIDKAQLYAARGMVRETMSVLESSRSIRCKHMAMAGVFAQCYSVQLEQKLKRKAPQSELELGIRNYVGMFGIDESILYFFDFFKNRYPTNTDLEMLKQGSTAVWTPAMVVNSITEAD